MDSLVCVSPGQLQVDKRPSPARRPGDVLVRPRRIGICGTDFHIFEGKHPFLQYPRIMGHELAVEVVDAPAGSGLSAGQICVVNPYLSCGVCIACAAGKPNCCVKISVLGVHQDGGMQELLPVPARNLLPAEGLSTDECATVEFLAIGAHAVRRGAVTAADRVAVVGAGPIGLGAALFAKLSGGAVTIFDRDPERAKSAGDIVGTAAHAVTGSSADIVAAHGDGVGFDVVFDATGNQAAMEQGFDLVAHGGRYVLVSVVKTQITFADPDFHRKEMTLLGSRNATSEDFDRVISSIRNRKVPIDRLITHRTSLAGAVKDLPVWATQKTGLIKAMIEIG
ncbi:MAG: zinc-binding alcohol dehydrogenase family protein [Proteobacteria bacterium]|nr:zinc-binding alcohol dehydrogenase family protein [Pseudomonadota bacterium]